MLELSCKAFAPPAPRLSLVQEIVREKMRHRFPGAQLGVKSWPSLLQRHEQAAEAAEQWEPPAEFPEDQDEAEDMCEDLCDEHKDEGCLQEQWAAMSRLMVAKLYQAMIKGIANRVKHVSIWLAWFSLLPQYLDSMVAAGAPHALVKVLRSDMHEAKGDAMMALVSIAVQQQYVGAVVAAGVVEACVAVLQTGPDDAKDNAARALANIADYKQHVGAVVVAGAVEACVTVLQTGPEDAKRGVMYLLAHISDCEQHAGAVAAAGAIPTILDSLNSDDKFFAALVLDWPK